MRSALGPDSDQLRLGAHDQRVARGCYLASEEGDVFVLQAGREFKLLATNRMGEITMATPAATGNTLVVRTQTQLVGIRSQG